MTDSSGLEETDPFAKLKLASFLPLEKLEGRSKCSACEASRKFFCYTCYLPVDKLIGRIPAVEIPFQLDVIKHPLEVDGKSTAVHAAVLAPKQVKLYTYPCIPEYKDPSKVLLVYPSESAKTIAEIFDQEERTKTGSDSDSEEATPPACKKTKKDPRQKAIPFERIIFIDSTWSQSKKIFKDERLRDLPCVILAEQKTFFWRSQDKEDNYLATIEAIYYFLVEIFKLTSDLQYAGQYDNLMYFFVYMYRMVQKQKKNYIKIHKKKKQKKTATHEAGVS